MLENNDRMIKPTAIKEQIPWSKLKGVVVLGLADVGEQNTLQMSSITIEELTFLSKQLDAHITCMMGHMKEV